jgi:ribonuclease HII
MQEFQIGIDEVGRGALAGPVAVGAMLVKANEIPLIVSDCERLIRKKMTDSKALTKLQRAAIQQYCDDQSLSYAVGTASASYIDKHGITAAVNRAMHLALGSLQVRCEVPENVLVITDAGIKRPDLPMQAFITEPKADVRYPVVSLASVVAKEYRDAGMRQLAEQDAYHAYGFAGHVGYASAAHIEAIRSRGLTDQHRSSFCTRILQAE